MDEPKCWMCRKSAECSDPFPEEECEEFEQKVLWSEIIELYEGMTASMQKAVLEIMKVSQVGGKDDKEGS